MEVLVYDWHSRSNRCASHRVERAVRGDAASWALATLGWKASTESATIWELLVGALARESSLMQLSNVHLSQLLQAHLASQFLRIRLITLPPTMLQAAMQAYREEAR